MRGRRRGLSYYFVRYGYMFLAGTIIFGGLCANKAAATECPSGIPQLDCEALLNNSLVWLPELCGGPASGDSSLSGDSAAQQIFNYFATRNYSPEQAAGIIGNTTAESANQPERLQGTSSGTVTPYDTIPAGSNLGWGITQWTPASKVGDFVATNGFDPNQLATQVNYLFQQLEGTSPVHQETGAGDALKEVTTGVTTDDGVQHDTAWHAAQVFLQYYERAADSNPNGNNAKVRGGLADSALAAFGGGTLSPDASANGSGCNTTTTSNSSCMTTPGAGPFNDGKAPNINIPSGSPIKDVATVCKRAQELNKSSISDYQQSKLSNIASDWCSRISGANTKTGCHDARCDYTASFMWGYGNSGYLYAGANSDDPIAGGTYHWNDLIAKGNGIAHVVGRDADAMSPPIGALLFYDNHIYGIGGHVTVYLGNNWTVSSDMNSNSTFSPGQVGIVNVYDITTNPTTHHGWGETYLGWADPYIAGQPLTAQEVAL